MSIIHCIYCPGPALHISGGWKTRIKPELTLMKEDMLSYHFFVFMRDRVRLSEEMKQMQLQTANSCFANTHFFHLQLMRRTREVDSAKIEVNRCTENETFGLQEKSTMM